MSNLYLALQALLPQPPLLVASVLTINGDGTTTITYPGGNQQRVRGEGAVSGGQVFVRNGVIEGVAPALTTLTIEV